MNPVEAYNLLVNAARQLKLTAAEHEQITQAALTLKPIVEDHVQKLQIEKKEEAE